MTGYENYEAVASNTLKKDKALSFVKVFSIISVLLIFGTGIFSEILGIVFDGYHVEIIKYYLQDLFDFFLFALPVIILLIYLFVFFNKGKGNWLLAISFGTMGLASFIFAIRAITNLIKNTQFNDAYFEYFPTTAIFRLYVNPALDILFNLAVVCFSVFYIVNCVSKFKLAKITRIVTGLHLVLAILYALSENLLRLINLIDESYMIFSGILTKLSWCIWELTCVLPVIIYFVFWGIVIKRIKKEKELLQNQGTVVIQ